MSPIQRRACLKIGEVRLGHAPWAWQFTRSLRRLAQRDDWPLYELTESQLRMLATLVQRYRRQVKSPDLLFWAQRTLAEQQANQQEEPCRS